MHHPPMKMTPLAAPLEIIFLEENSMMDIEGEELDEKDILENRIRLHQFINAMH